MRARCEVWAGTRRGMGPVVGWALGCALVAGASAAGAGAGEPGGPVRVELKDGRTLEGRLVAARPDGTLELELESGSIRARVTIPPGEVARRHGVGPDAGAVEREARAAAARGVEEPGARARALAALAREVEETGAPEAAAALWAEAGAADPALRDETDVAQARALVAAGREVEAEAALTGALERNPKNLAARAVARQLEEAFARRAEELLEPGLAAWAARDPRRALRLLEDAVARLPRRVLDAASERVQAQSGLTLPQVLVDCRLQATCRRCEGAGVVACPASTGNAPTRCRFGYRQTVLRVEEEAGLRFARRDRCGRCDGMGHLGCDDCFGLGLAIGKPTAYEREALLGALEGQLSGLEARAQKLADAGPGLETAEGALRSVAGTELVQLLQGLRGTSRALTKLDPHAAAIGGGDHRRKAQQSGRQLAGVLTALANALFVLGERRYEDAVSSASGRDGQGEAVPAAVRAMRARQAWEAVNQARIYSLEALRLDPSTAGPLGGDLERRVALMEGFLGRTWRTYRLLRAAEEGAGGPRQGDLARKLAAAAGDLGQAAQALSEGEAAGTVELGGRSNGRSRGGAR